MAVPKVVLASVFVFLLSEPHQALGFQTTSPALLWSSHGSADINVREVVDYRTLSLKDLAKSVFSVGGWANVLCSRDNLSEKVDVALVFVGKKLESLDVSSTKQLDPFLLDILKISFTSSNFSMAFPYVAFGDDKEELESSLMSAFSEGCGHQLGVNRMAYLGSCSVKDKNFLKLQDLDSIQDFLDSRVGGNTDLIVSCGGVLDELNHDQSEGEILSGVINSLQQHGIRYTILYTSDPQRSVQHRNMTLRFLAEGTLGNFSLNSTCDSVCQVKKSLLEGIFVAIVLLIILISGLCCMMGIETPKRFEIPQES